MENKNPNENTAAASEEAKSQGPVTEHGRAVRRMMDEQAKPALGQNSVDQAAEPILKFFSYVHLPPALAAVSRPYSELALSIVTSLPRNAERSVALRKLLESKDAAVRAAL